MGKLFTFYYEGSIDIDSKGFIFFSTQVPVSNKIYRDGLQINSFFRKEFENQLPDLTKRYDLTCPAVIKMKIVDDSFVFNFITIRKGKKRLLIDIYSKDGKILRPDIVLPPEINDLGRIKHIDDSGNLYFEQFTEDGEDIELVIYRFDKEKFYSLLGSSDGPVAHKNYADSKH